MITKLIRCLPGVLLLGACAHQSTVEMPPASGTSPAVAENHVGIGVEPLPAAKAADDYMGAVLSALDKSFAECETKQWQPSRLPDGSIRIQAWTATDFEVDSAELRPLALDALDRIAKVAKTYNKTVLHVLADGRDAKVVTFSQSLSDRRAAALASYLGLQGIDGTRVRSEGASRLNPGLLQIVIKPIVSGAEQQAWMPPS